MFFREESINGVIVLEISGKMNTETSEDLDRELALLIDHGARHLLLDLSGVDYINSSGLRVLLTAARRMTNLRAKMVLAEAPELICQILHVSGCASHIGIYASREEALKALKD